MYPMGNPTRNIFGWQKPCYLIGEGYVNSFKELMNDTDWINMVLETMTNVQIVWLIVVTKHQL